MADQYFIPYFYECYNMLTHGNIEIQFYAKRLGVLKLNIYSESLKILEKLSCIY